MQLVTKKLSEIKPYPKNPRNNDDAVDSVAQSIKEYGFNVPIVLDADNVIICGHTRYKAAQKLGIDELPCIVADNLSKKQAKAFRIADNKTSDASIWDNKLLLEELFDIGDEFFTGFDFSDIESLTLLDEKENDVIQDNEYGVAYEVVFRSDNKDKIEKIKKIWDGLENE